MRPQLLTLLLLAINAMIAVQWVVVNAFAFLVTWSHGGQQHQTRGTPPKREEEQPHYHSQQCMITCPVDLDIGSVIANGAKDDVDPTPDPPPRRGGD
jgi:hypothetical protein